MEAILLVTLQDGSALRGQESYVRGALSSWWRYAEGPAYPHDATRWPLQSLLSGNTLLVRAINPDYVALVTEVPADAE